MSISRRQFLNQAAASAMAGALLPSFTSANTAIDSAGRSRPRSLLLIFLDGGNDGLNTVIPYADDRYHQARPRLRINKGNRIRLDDEIALHASLGPLLPWYEAGKLSILHDVGYPSPDLSHFVSRDIWHRGRRAVPQQTRLDSGWAARVWSAEKRNADQLPPISIATEEPPLLLRGPRSNGVTLNDLDLLTKPSAKSSDASIEPIDQTQALPDGPLSPLQKIQRARAEALQLRAQLAKVDWDASDPGVFPQTQFGLGLRSAACMMRLPKPPPVIWLSLGGFDTHAVQAGTHAALLNQLARGLHALQVDLERDGSDERMLTLVYSEFGRRVAENGSVGTDHGAAGPMFALGKSLRGGRVGSAPRLDKLVAGNLAMQLDYRAVFAEALRSWLQVPTEGLFDGPAEVSQSPNSYLLDD